MAKKSAQEDAPSLREKILQAAIIEFGDKGFAGARMDEISHASGASKQVLYHHYINKEGLFEAALTEGYRRFRGTDEILRSRVEALEPEAALREFVEHLFAPSVETVRFQRLIHDENRFAGVHVAAIAEARTAYERLMEIMGDILQRGAGAGVFQRDLDPVQVYVSLAGLFMFRITNAHTLSILLGLGLDTEEGARRSRDEALELILKGLRA